MIINLQDELPAVRGVLAGVDEAGRGPLAGNVVAAAVVLDAARPIEGLTDSKLLEAERREELAARVREQALCCAVVSVSPADIDRLNILYASLLAMRRAVELLETCPDHVFVDGNRCPDGMAMASTAVIKGDLRVAEISAASILAKVERDAQMRALHETYPQYGFDRHKGYATREHIAALMEHGPCPVHRQSYQPVRVAVARLRESFVIAGE